MYDIYEGFFEQKDAALPEKNELEHYCFDISQSIHEIALHLTQLFDLETSALREKYEQLLKSNRGTA